MMGHKKHALFSIKVQKVKFFLFLVTKVFLTRKIKLEKLYMHQKYSIKYS